MCRIRSSAGTSRSPGRGPVLIEGNALPDLAIIEMAAGRGLMAHASFRKLYEDVTATT